MGMSELAKSHMSPALPVIQEVYRQPEVMNGVVITYRMYGGLMRNYGCQAEQNRHISGWKMEGKTRRNITASMTTPRMVTITINIDLDMDLLQKSC